ncbi:MAG: 4-hydroxythreonine-4-phosphate dehydrogenase PdxA [Alloprevotella sp.]|nr:4-hydroxythreonine-4-phosphate dehydrogenase PdxA [Alloprevotella sp.]MBR1645112.1 4-hydroxythreonine-4-phosphate dehydrogenase PdxA [Bacteroidales bacterium]MBR1652572.1 4-hydroxythreonine-4-phosphate dehydrogenase PdxA [Alloprevotella sp.]
MDKEKNINEKRRVRVAITQGDTNGVGYELILKTFADAEMLEICTPVVYGSPKTATYHRKAINSQTNFALVQDGAAAQDGALNLVSCYDEEVKVDLGMSTPEAGKAARLALERAVKELKAGYVDVLVTCPINKATIKAEDFPFVGHTEFLEARLGDEDSEALMIMTSQQMRVALVTTHLGIRQVADAITAESVERKARLFLQSLRRDFLLPAPRIAILSLNPHNGDHGAIGTEEEEILMPVVDKLAGEGLAVFGPYAADGFFGTGHHRHFDGILAMYHDQGLIPFKTVSMGNGVNFTAGLPYVRTSPDHGTAYEIAGRDDADITSFREAIYAAIDIFRNRRADDEAHANPLPKLYQERREDERPRRFSRDQEQQLPQ